jgi:hypothetical protein
VDPRAAAGLITIQYVVATALSLVVFVALANAVVDLYTRGVARAAVDEGARAGAVLDATADDCRRRARGVLDGAVAPGTVEVDCREAGGSMRARARVVLDGWIPGIPSWRFTLEGAVLKEAVVKETAP